VTQLFLKESQLNNSRIEYDKEIYHHLLDVCRVRVGETLSIVTELSRYEVALKSIKKNHIVINIIHQQKLVEEKTSFVLFQSLPKQDKFTTIIDHVVQLGVSDIFPIITARTVVKWDSSKKNKNMTRWAAKTKSAAMQAKQDMIPLVHPVQTISELLDTTNWIEYGHLYVCWEEERDLKSIMSIKQSGSSKKIGVLIGPEGGLEEKEIDMLKHKGFKVVSLGRSILRVEIAAIVALSQLKILLE